MDGSSRAFKRALLEEDSASSSGPEPSLSSVRLIFSNSHLVEKLDDLSNPGVHPDYINNIFPDAEDFPGYSGLDVAVYITAGSLYHHVKVMYETEGDLDIMHALRTNLYQNTLIPDFEEFTGKISERFAPPGSKIMSFKRGKAEYDVYISTMDTPGFREYHVRLRTLPVWFIDGGSVVDSTEPHWTYFTLYKRAPTGPILVGLISCYAYYQTMDRCRVRISQVLILPQYQRQGHGAQLLSAVYAHFRADKSVFEINVEDCSPEMQHLRDVTDLKDVLETGFVSLNTFKLEKSVETMVKRKLKLTSNQINRAIQLLQYASIDVHDEEAVRVWRVAVKRYLLSINYETLRPKEDKLPWKHIYIRTDYLDDDTDGALDQEILKKIQQDSGPMQEYSAAIVAQMKERAGRKQAVIEYTTDQERRV